MSKSGIVDKLTHSSPVTMEARGHTVIHVVVRHDRLDEAWCIFGAAVQDSLNEAGPIWRIAYAHPIEVVRGPTTTIRQLLILEPGPPVEMSQAECSARMSANGIHQAGCADPSECGGDFTCESCGRLVGLCRSCSHHGRADNHHPADSWCIDCCRRLSRTKRST